jgi:hypothetical protein
MAELGDASISGIAYLSIFFRCRLRGRGEGQVWVFEGSVVSPCGFVSMGGGRERGVEGRGGREREREKERKGVRVTRGYSKMNDGHNNEYEDKGKRVE